MGLGAQNMKKGPDALDTDENESESAKHKNETDALDIVKNASGSAKQYIGTRHRRCRRKWSESTKHGI
jgi:hypothetical protein